MMIDLRIAETTAKRSLVVLEVRPEMSFRGNCCGRMMMVLIDLFYYNQLTRK